MCNGCGGNRRPPRNPMTDPYATAMATTQPLGGGISPSRQSAFDTINNMRVGGGQNNIVGTWPNKSPK